MQQWYVPPTRKSILATRTIVPLGPHQCVMRSGLVHAFQTTRRGASKTREMTKTGSLIGFPLWVVFKFQFNTAEELGKKIVQPG